MVYSYSIVRSMGADTTPWKKWKAPGVIVRNGRGKPNLGSEVGMPSFDVWVEVRRRLVATGTASTKHGAGSCD